MRLQKEFFRGFKVFKKLAEYLASKAFIFLTIFVLGSVTGIAYALIKLDRDNYLASVRSNLEEAMHVTTDQIQLRFFEAVLVAKTVESILLVSGGTIETQISRVVEEYQRHNPAVIAVALAPDLEVTHSFPQTKNRGSIGLKYWEIPAQMAGVAQAFRNHSPVVDGPVSLVQGGEGYILHYPVFLPNPDLNNDQFWGIISIVIQSESLLGKQQYELHDAENYMFTLRQLKASGLPAATATGYDPMFNNESVIVQFQMLGSNWQAAAQPTDGWPSYSPQSPYLLGFALFSKLILIGMLWAYRRAAIKKANAHALLAEAVDCIDEGFIAFDDDERLMIVNQRYLDYHSDVADFVVKGMTMEDLLRLSLTHQQHSAAVEQGEAWIATRLESFRNPGDAFLQDVGDDLWLKVTEARTPSGYTVGIWTDITDQKLAQEQAEAADREKTEFLDNVSHELRTPLTVIFGRATFIKNSEKLPQSKKILASLENEGTSPQEAQLAVSDYQRFISEQGTGIANSAQHMIRLVEDLLDWTKVTRGQLELDMSVIQVGEVAETIVQDLQPNALAKGLTLTYSDDGAPEALADTVRLKQILYNLVNNAIKFTTVGGIHLSMTHDDDKIVLSVADTGHGISEEDAGRVFQRFQQVDGSMTRQNGGLGLGLAISQQLAALHDGKLSLESTLGKGSTFSMCLPRRKQCSNANAN